MINSLLTKMEDHQACHDMSIKLGLPLLIPTKHKHVCLPLLLVVAATHVVLPGTKGDLQLLRKTVP